MYKIILLFVVLLQINSYSACAYQSGCVESCSLLACEGGFIRPSYQSTVQNWCTTRRNSLDQSRLVSFSCGGCSQATYFDVAGYSYYYCNTAREADSLSCLQLGKIWDVDPVTGVTSCVDSVSCSWLVSEIPRLRCIDVPASSQIVCKGSECSGLPYSMWWSELRIDSTSTRCGNISHTHTSDTSYAFGVSCDEEEHCSTEKKCYSEGGQYYIIEECAIGRPVVGNDGVSQKTVPYIVSQGKGSCSEMGYRNESYSNYGNSGTAGNQQAVQGQPSPMSDDCIVYGVGCPEKDTTDYNSQNNRNPSKCFCEPFDGNARMSKVTCPDGSVSIYYFSCREWEMFYYSSSSVQNSSTSTPPSSVGGTSSSGGGASSDSFGQYPQYPEDDRNYRQNVQAALSGESSLLQEIKNILGNIKDYLFTDDVLSFGEGDLYETPTDSSTYDTIYINVLDSLYSVLDTAKSPIDTSLLNQTGVCPKISMKFGTNCKKIMGIAGNHDADIYLDTADFFGFNLCSIIKAIIVGFGSVVSFIISARMFRQINLF